MISTPQQSGKPGQAPFVLIVQRLLAAQLPEWAALPLALVKSAGSDNVLDRLGDDMVVRLPRRNGRTEDYLDKEFTWLPRLAPHLPLAVPLPLARGAAGEGYPCGWAVFSWLELAAGRSRSR